MAVSIEAQRDQLARLYIAVIAADGMPAVHRLLSTALIDRRSKDKSTKAPPREQLRRPPKPRGPATIAWRGKTLQLGEAMRRLNSRQQLFVLAVVHDGKGTREAELAAGYSAGGGPKRSPYIQAAIAEEKRREQAQ